MEIFKNKELIIYYIELILMFILVGNSNNNPSTYIERIFKPITLGSSTSKGLEAKVAILVNVDKFILRKDKDKEILDRKLVYVGMTRASENLFIHSYSFDDNSFAQDIKNIYRDNFIYA